MILCSVLRSKFRLSYYPHRLESFSGLMTEAFHGKLQHQVFGDFKTYTPGQTTAPCYFIHVCRKTAWEQEKGLCFLWADKSYNYASQNKLVCHVSTCTFKSPLSFISVSLPGAKENLIAPEFIKPVGAAVKFKGTQQPWLLISLNMTHVDAREALSHLWKKFSLLVRFSFPVCALETVLKHDCSVLEPVSTTSVLSNYPWWWNIGRQSLGMRNNWKFEKMLRQPFCCLQET